MFALFISSLQNLYSEGIFYSRKPENLVTIYVIMGIVNIIFSIYIAKNYGIIGVVYTFIIVKIITSFWVYFISRKYFAFNAFNKNTIIYICLFIIILLLSIFNEYIMYNICSFLIIITFIFLLNNILNDLQRI